MVERCMVCPNHCPKDKLKCARGRKFFGVGEYAKDKGGIKLDSLNYDKNSGILAQYSKKKEEA